MDLSKINVGDTIKNYKEMCRLLGETSKAGKGKHYQLENWNTYFTYHKRGHKFIIDEIYNVPKEKHSKKFGYINYIEELVLDLLVQEENKGSVLLSKNRLFRELNMINDNYNFGRYNVPKLSQLISVDENNIREFYDLSSSTLARSLENALNRLKNKSLIFWQSVKTVCVIDPHVKTNETGNIKAKEVYKGKNEYDEEIYNYNIDYHVNKKHREATEEEVQIILRTEREMLKELGCTSKQDVIKQGKWDLFVKGVKDVIFDKINVLYYYESYKIINNEDQVYEVWEDLKRFELGELDRMNKQHKLNSTMKDKLNKNAENRSIQAKKELQTKEYIERRSKENYLKDYNKLTDTLIDHTYDDIRQNIRNTKLNK